MLVLCHLAAKMILHSQVNPDYLNSSEGTTDSEEKNERK